MYALGDRVPQIHPDAYVHPDATVIGDVTLGAGSSVWPSAVLRGDYGTITVGERTSIQDGTVVHATHDKPTTIGSECVIGHLVHLEGCTIEDGCLVGNGSIVLHRAVVHSGAIVAANSVLLNRTIVRLAYEYDLPVWNYWLAVQGLPDRGLDRDPPRGGGRGAAVVGDREAPRCPGYGLEGDLDAPEQGGGRPREGQLADAVNGEG